MAVVEPGLATMETGVLLRESAHSEATIHAGDISTDDRHLQMPGVAPASVRWSTLIGETLLLAEAFPETAPSRRRRRYGEAALPSLGAPPPWLEAAVGHMLGVLSRCCMIDAVSSRSGAGKSPEVLEALLMVAAVDHLLAVRLRWAGRDYWRDRPLAARLLGRPAIDLGVRSMFQKALAARDERFVAAAPVLSKLGLSGLALSQSEDERLLALVTQSRRSQVKPTRVTPMPALPGPHRPKSTIGVGRAAVPILIAMATAIGYGQYLWWDAMLSRLSGILSTL